MATKFYVQVNDQKTSFSGTAATPQAGQLLRIQVSDVDYLDRVRLAMTTDDAALIWDGTVYAKGQLGFTYGPAWVPEAGAFINVFDCKKA